MSDTPPATTLDSTQEEAPLDLPSSVVVLTKETPEYKTTFYVIGTAHVSKASVNDVSNVIKQVHPDTVFLELDQMRAGLLHAKEESVMSEYQKDISYAEFLQPLRERRGFAGVLQVLLSIIFRKVVKKIKVLPGGEFRRGYEEAKEIKARVILGDRPIKITLARTWASLSTWERIKLAYLILSEPFDIKEEDIERFKNADIITEMIEEVTKHFPSLIKPILHERDLFLAYSLRSCASPECKKVVAIVGMGHVKGMEKHWNADIDIKELMRTPQKKPSAIWQVTKGLAVVFVIYFSCKYIFGWTSWFGLF